MSSQTLELSGQSVVDVRPVTGSIGAEILGVGLKRELASGVLQTVRSALHQYKVIFFRGQLGMTDREHEAFANQLGGLLKHPLLPAVAESDYVLEFHSARGGRANSWHTDMTFMPDFPALGVFRVNIVPPFGGDTMFANAVRAYDMLPAPLKAMVESMHGIHSNVFDYAGMQSSVTKAGAERYKSVYTSTVYQTEHPIVAIHPHTGARSLLLGHFLRRIVGLNSSDSQHVIAMLQDHITIPENCLRWRWQPGDVAVWDNRATQHRAIDDFGDQERSVKRVTVAGDVVVGIDGFRSHLCE